MIVFCCACFILVISSHTLIMRCLSRYYAGCLFDLIRLFQWPSSLMSQCFKDELQNKIGGGPNISGMLACKAGGKPSNGCELR